MEVSGKLHAPAALPPEKELRCPLIGGRVGPRAGLKTVAKRKIACPYQEPNPSHPARFHERICEVQKRHSM